MRELDRSKIYDLSELNKYEFYKVLQSVGLSYNYKFCKTEAIRHLLYSDGKWQLTIFNNMEYTDAKELFTPQYDVTRIVEKTKEEMKTFKVIKSLNEYLGFLSAESEDKAWESYKIAKNLNDSDKVFYSFVEINEDNHPLKLVFDKAKEVAKDISNELQAYKEKTNKLNYELDFNFITQLAERMSSNKGKYEPYNWQKLDNIEDLKQALFRHVIEVMRGNFEDDKRPYGHLEAIALNCMFINYQLKNETKKV